MESEVRGVSLINGVTTAVANHIKSEEKSRAACVEFVFLPVFVRLLCLYHHSNPTYLFSSKNQIKHTL